MSERDFERISSTTVYEGRIFSVVQERFRFADGQEADRDLVRHPGAVGIVAHDDEHVVLVRQPREAVGDPDVLEIPAGKLDVVGEPPLETGKRELAEEVGRAAEHWAELGSFFTSVGICDEEIHLFLATGLSEVEQPAVEEDERIELVLWPLDDLDGAIAATKDSKTIIGLMRLQQRLQREG